MNWLTAINIVWSVILLGIWGLLAYLARRVKADAQRNLEVAKENVAEAEKNARIATTNAANATQNAKMAADLSDMAKRMRTHYLLMTKD